MTDGFVTSGNLPPPIPLERHLEIAQSGTPADRWTLAGQPDLSVAAFEALGRTADASVAGLLAVNEATPPHVLQLIAQDHPEVADMAASNPGAPLALRQGSPAWVHSDDSIGRYLEAKSASPSQRRAFLKEFYRLQGRGFGPTLGELWAQVAE